jgi:predicted dithiol-disulfide oxidoreductase (DUF899 family)
VTEPRNPNETPEYRQARDALLQEEQALVARVKAVAEQRRRLPLGGRLKEDYTFVWATDDRLGHSVKFSELFGGKDTLLIYSFMYGPSWDNPCPSCTSIVDGFDRMANQVGEDAAFVVIGKAPANKINAWARRRGWSQIDLVSGFESSYQSDYGCQRDSDDKPVPRMHVFKEGADGIYHFWGTELTSNDLDIIWLYWNLMDLTPAGRPARPNPPQDFRSRFLEENYSA